MLHDHPMTSPASPLRQLFHHANAITALPVLQDSSQPSDPVLSTATHRSQSLLAALPFIGLTAAVMVVTWVPLPTQQQLAVLPLAKQLRHSSPFIPYIGDQSQLAHNLLNSRGQQTEVIRGVSLCFQMLAASLTATRLLTQQ